MGALKRGDILGDVLKGLEPFRAGSWPSYAEVASNSRVKRRANPPVRQEKNRLRDADARRVVGPPQAQKDAPELVKGFVLRGRSLRNCRDIETGQRAKRFLCFL